MKNKHRPKKTDPIVSARIALSGLLIAFIVIGTIACFAAVGTEDGGVVLQGIAALTAIVGACCLLNADLISIWRREDDEGQIEPKKTTEIEGVSVSSVRRGAAFVGTLLNPWKKRNTVAADKARQAREAADAEIKKQRQEQEDREAVAKERWLLRGHFCVVLAAMLAGIGFFSPSTSESGDQEADICDHCSTETPEPSDTPTGP